MTATLPVVDELRRALGERAVVTDRDVLAAHRRDRAEWGSAGEPAVLVRARSTSDVATTLRAASRRGVPVVPRGAGSGLSGGSNAIDGCIVLAVDGMDRILDVDARDRLAVVQPGVLNGDLKAALAGDGLWYPPDPASQAFCSIGGNVNTNAGGLCCVKYGVTRDWVAGLEVVLADGRVVRTGGRTRKNVAGYDLTQLLIGSEGTLGVVTEVTVRIRDLPPPASTLVAFFPGLQEAGDAVAAILAATTPSLLELLDRATVRAVEDYRAMGLDTDAAALLLVQSDAATLEGRRQEVEAARAARAACERAGASYLAVTDDPDEGEQLLVARRLAIPSLERSGATLLDDVSVPPSRVPAYVAEVPPVADRFGLPIATFGHAGDGNLHPTIVFDPADADARDRARQAFGALLDVALALGGSITGEHGVGSLKLAWLGRQVGQDVRDLSRGIKQAFDPQGILNPGKAI